MIFANHVVAPKIIFTPMRPLTNLVAPKKPHLSIHGV